MDLKFRQLVREDYDTLLEWWGFWRFNPPSREILPNNGLDGIMVTKDGVNVCAGFLYATSSPHLFWVEWIVSNPEVKDKELRSNSISFVIDKLTEMAKDVGGTVMYTTLKNPHLEKYYSKHGFLVTGRKNIEMIKNIYGDKEGDN